MKTEYLVFFRDNLAEENRQAIKQKRCKTLAPQDVATLPDANFPIIFHLPIDADTIRCIVCVSPDEERIAVLDVARETFENLPTFRIDSDE